MTKYSREILVTQNAIKSKGALVVWRKLIRNVNSAQPWKGSNTQQDFNVFVLFLNKGISDSSIQIMSNTDVTDGAPDALMAGGLSFEPEITDSIITNNIVYAFSNIDIVAPDGTPILYRLRFR